MKAFADQAGDELAKMELRLDGKELEKFEVKAANAGETQTFEKRVTIPAGKKNVGAAFLNDYYKQLDGKTEDRNLHVVSISVAGPIGKLSGDLPEPHRRLMITAGIARGVRSVRPEDSGPDCSDGLAAISEW